MHAHTYIHIQYIHACIHIHLNTVIYIDIFWHNYTYMHTYIQMYMYICLYMYVYVCMYMYACICMYMYVCICMYVRVYAYMCMHVCITYWGNCPGEMSYPKREGNCPGGNCP